jgi:hypothetical protein
MSTIVLRSVKGTPLSNTEVDTNFSNLNTDKTELGGTYSAGTANGVLFLSSSKVLTTGSALKFDGTNFNVSSSGQETNINGKTILFYNTGAGDALIRSADDSSTVTSIGINKTDIKFYSSGSEQMRLTSTGLGIGTSSPNQRLDVAGTANAVALGTTLAYGTGGEVYSAFRFGNSSFSGGNSEIRNIVNGAASTGSALAFLTTQTGGGPLTERLRIDNQGNLGLGVTPSAWSSDTKAIQISSVSLSSTGNSAQYMQNGYYNAGYKYVGTGNAVLYEQNKFNGSHNWFTAPSGTAGDAISFTQAMTLDANAALILDGGTGKGRITLENGATANTIFSTLTAFGAYNILRNRASQHQWLDGAGTQAMTLDASGNLGVGTTSASERLVVSNTYRDVSSAEFTQIIRSTSSQATGRGGSLGFEGIFTGTSPTSFAGLLGAKENSTDNNSSGYLAFLTRANGSAIVEKARIDSSGNLLVGTTASSPNPGFFVSPLGYMTLGNNAQASGFAFVSFDRSGTNIGSITQSGTTAVLYNVMSDQRAKENIQDAAPASSLIDALQVRQYDWKSDGSHQRYGFIAQELVTVAPEAVHQPADPEEMMAVDYSKLVPMLVKEIQSLRARLAAANI